MKVSIDSAAGVRMQPFEADPNMFEDVIARVYADAVKEHVRVSEAKDLSENGYACPTCKESGDCFGCEHIPYRQNADELPYLTYRTDESRRIGFETVPYAKFELPERTSEINECRILIEFAECKLCTKKREFVQEGVPCDGGCPKKNYDLLKIIPNKIEAALKEHAKN